MQDIRIALLTNPIFRAKCFTEILEYAVPGYSTSSMYDTTPMRTLFLNRNLSVKLNKTASKDVEMKLHMDFSFTGNGRSEKVMYEFIKMLSGFLKEIKHDIEKDGKGKDLLKQGTKNEYFIDTRAILENYLLYLNDGVKGLNVNAAAYLPSSGYKKAIQLLSDVLRKLKNNAKIIDFVSQDEQSLIVRYISGADGVINAFYTVWKYNVIALYHRLAKLMDNDNNNYKIDVSGDFDTTIRITVDTSMKTLCQAFDRLITIRTLQRVIDVMFQGVELEISSAQYPSTDDFLEIMGENDYLMQMLGILPLIKENILDRYDEDQCSDSYTLVMPLANNTSTDMIETLRNVDYTILLDAPERLSSSQLPSYNIFGDMWDTVVNALTDYTTVDEMPSIEGENYRIVPGNLVPEGTFLNIAQYLLTNYAVNVDSDSINGLCNDLMVNEINNSTYTKLLESLPLEEIDSDDIDLEQIFSGISENDKELSKLKVQDVFAREKLNVNNISTKFLDGDYDTGKFIDEYIGWYIDNSSSNRPVNTFNLQAVSFGADVRKPLPFSDFYRNVGEDEDVYIEIEADEDFEDNLIEISTFGSESIYRAIEHKEKLESYQKAIDRHLAEHSDLVSVITEDVFSGNELNTTSDSDLISSVTGLVKDFESMMYKKLSNLLASGDDEIIDNCIYNLILGDVSTDLYRRLFDSKMKELVRKADFRNILIKELNFSDEEVNNSDGDMIMTSTMTGRLTQALQQIGFMMRDCIRCSLLKNNNLLSNKKTIRTFGGIDYNSLDMPNLSLNSRESFLSYVESLLSAFRGGDLHK